MKVSLYKTPFGRFQRDYSDNTAAYLSRLPYRLVDSSLRWMMPREEMTVTIPNIAGERTEEYSCMNYAIIDYSDIATIDPSGKITSPIMPLKWFYFAEYSPDDRNATSQAMTFRFYIDWWGMYVNLSDETPITLCKGLLRRSHVIYSQSLTNSAVADSSGLLNQPDGIKDIKGIRLFGGGIPNSSLNGYGYTIIVKYKVQSSIISALSESKYIFAAVTPTNSTPSPNTNANLSRRNNAMIDFYQLSKIGKVQYDTIKDGTVQHNEDIVTECAGAWVVPSYIGGDISSDNFSIGGTLTTEQGVIIVKIETPTVYDNSHGAPRILTKDFFATRSIETYVSLEPSYNTLKMVGNMQTNVKISGNGFDRVAILDCMIALSNADVKFRVMVDGIYTDLTDSLSVNVQTSNNYLDNIKTIISGISGFSGGVSSIAVGAMSKSPAAISGGIESLASQSASYIGYAPTFSKYQEGMNGIINMSIRTKSNDEIYTMGIALMRFTPLNENDINAEFNSYGFSGAVQALKIPERSEQAYCYYQVENPKIGQSEQIPERAKQKICEILAEGVTIWSDRLQNRYCTTRTWA